MFEKQTLRTIVQALQQYSREAKDIFDNAKASSSNEVIVLAEDLVQYALEVAEVFPMNKRFAGFIDYKRARWSPFVSGLMPQVLLVDAKASKENNRDTLQRSQLPMDAEFRKADKSIGKLGAGVPGHLEIPSATSEPIYAVTTTILIHYYYQENVTEIPPFRDLRSIFALAIPHGRLKGRYNPDPDTTFFGEGKHSSARNEDPRIRVYFSRLRSACPWRLQELKYVPGQDFSFPLWREGESLEEEIVLPFSFLPR